MKRSNIAILVLESIATSEIRASILELMSSKNYGGIVIVENEKQKEKMEIFEGDLPMMIKNYDMEPLEITRIQYKEIYIPKGDRQKYNNLFKSNLNPRKYIQKNNNYRNRKKS